MNNTPTPRTDERKASFALDTIRQLESELAAVTEQRDGLRSGIDYASDQLTAVTEQRDAVTLRLGDTQVRMFDAERQRDRLAEALKQIQGVGLVAVDAFDELDRIDEIVDEALQSLNQPTP